MARGPKKHLKRLNAPRHWMLDKLSGIWAPRPSTGPHKLRECIPLLIVLRNRLKYGLTRRECMMIVKDRQIKIDHKVRTDVTYPAGFMDVITIDKTDEYFRLLYDVKGRFVLHRITKDNAQFKLCRVKRFAKGKPSAIGRNPLQHKQAGAVPYIVTHDGRTIRYPDPHIRVNDTVKLNLETGKIEAYAKFTIGNIAMVTGGHNLGRVGVILHRDKHPGSFDIIHLQDKKGQTFATRIANVFIIGESQTEWVSLPKGKGVRLTIAEEKAKRIEKGQLTI
uniref:40S ribosomal protein S4 n=1 Tax=Hirondellea gigas TaxID=1518452 RepID=A0A6A7FWV0_9CRUS